MKQYKLSHIARAASLVLRHAKPTSPIARSGRLVLTLLIMLLTTATAWADTETVSYIDADGHEQTVDATVLTGGETTIYNGWYVVTEAAVTYSDPITVSGGDVHLILADDASMTINSSYLAAIYFKGSGTLTIYGQDKGNGILIANAGPGGDGISLGGDLTINGGCVTARKGGDDLAGIYASYGSTITLNPTRHANSICSDGYRGISFTLKVADGKTLYDHTTPYSGTLDSDQIAAIAGKILRPDSWTDWTDNGDDTYTIHTATGWGVFCDLIADGESFSGKTVRLGADITVSRMAGSGDNPFCGNFDGGGNTLTFTATAADNYCAPFVGVKGGTTADDAITISNLNVKTNITANDFRHAAGLIALQSGHVNVTGCNADVTISSTVGESNPHDLYPAALVSQASSSDGGTLTVTGCTASGTISTDGKYAAGLVGIVQGTASISDCISSVTIDSSTSGDGTHGGIVAALSGVTNIYGTVFNGRLLGEDTESVGGFIGWRNKGANIYNSLFIPTEVTVKKANSATFARNDVDTHNCYYTYYLCDGEHYVPYYATDGITRRNGHATRTVTADADVTIGAVALTGTATQYDVSGITAYSGGGLQLGQTLYYGSGDVVSLTLSNTATGAPQGYQYDGYTASAGTLDGSTLTMPDADVTISVSTDHLASTGQAVPVPYVDADGTLHDGDNAAQAVALDGSENSLAAGTYFVGLENVNFVHTITLTGNVTLILKDGCEMKVGTDDAPIVGDRGITYSSGSPSLTIYGQSLVAATAGHLYIYAGNDNSSDMGIAIGSNYTQHSGNVTIVSTDHGIGANVDITLNGGSLSVSTSKTNTIRTYNGNVALNGGQFEARFTGSGSTAAVRAENGTITLGWTTASDFIYASSYSGTVKVADGKKLHNGSDYLGGTLGDPATAVNGKTLRPAANTPYTTADGTAATADAILLDGSDNSLPAGNYLATGTLNYTHGITLTGNVTLILADNCHMKVGTSGEGRINGNGIDGYDSNTNVVYDLTITSQSLGDDMGALSVYTTGMNDGIYASALTINGGNITADTNGFSANALRASGGDLTINSGTVSANTTGTDADALIASGNFNYNGGNVTATAPNGTAIRANGNYTFSWRTPADRITIGTTGLYAPAAKTATFTRLFTDATGNYYGATLTGDELNALAGKTLQPVTAINLTARQAPDGNYWTTYYNGTTGFTIDKNENACAYTATYGDGQLTLHKLGKEIPAETAVIIVADNDVVSMTAATDLGAFSGDNDLHGVDVDTQTSTLGTGTFYVLGMTTVDDEQHFGFHRYTGSMMAAHKAYVLVDNSQARSLTMVFDDATGIESAEADSSLFTLHSSLSTWFTLDGRRLQAKPTAPGIYINNGRKVVIK